MDPQMRPGPRNSPVNPKNSPKLSCLCLVLLAASIIPCQRTLTLQRNFMKSTFQLTIKSHWTQRRRRTIQKLQRNINLIIRPSLNTSTLSFNKLQYDFNSGILQSISISILFLWEWLILFTFVDCLLLPRSNSNSSNVQIFINNSCSFVYFCLRSGFGLIKIVHC